MKMLIRLSCLFLISTFLSCHGGYEGISGKMQDHQNCPVMSLLAQSKSHWPQACNYYRPEVHCKIEEILKLGVKNGLLHSYIM